MTTHKVMLQFTMPQGFMDGTMVAPYIEEAMQEIAEADLSRDVPFTASNGVRVTAPRPQPRPMEVFIDCEWNGYGGGLISMALVAMDGSEMYLAVPLFEEIKPWVAENVVPVIGDVICVGKLELAYHIRDFLAPYRAVHLIADWPEDIQRFCECLVTGPGLRVDTPALTMEIRRDMDDADSAVPHNALEDARAMRSHYLTLMGDV